MIQLRLDCLNYLQSFHILNKFLIKMLFFPRESTASCPVISDASGTDSNVFLIDSFDDWMKDLFLISCCAVIPDYKSHTHALNSKLFEFQSITINTFLELINLSESVNSHYKETLADSLKKLSIIAFNTPETKVNKNVCFVQTVFNSKQIELIYNR